MAKEELNRSMQKIGKVVRYLRKNKQMSPVEFAAELDKTALLIDIIEQAGTPAGDALCKLLLPHEIDDLRVCLEEVSGQTLDELYAAAEHLDEPSANDGEVTLYLPVTISVERAVDMLDRIVLLAASGRECERYHVLRGEIQSTCMLVQLLHTYYLRQGLTAEANACIERFSDMIEARK